jgi:hypothetical protein
MITRFLAPLVFVATAAIAADLPKIPSKPIAEKKGELLFSDDMEAAEHDKRWHRVVDTFAVEDGALKGTQTRVKDVPSADGKSIIKAHAAVYGLEMPTKDSVVECKMRFDGCTMMDVEFDDRKYTGSHYGHLCRAQVRLDKVTIMDEREGSQNEVQGDETIPPRRPKSAKLMAGRSATFPVKLKPVKPTRVVVETVGDEMRVTHRRQALCGTPRFLKSSGIATCHQVEDRSRSRRGRPETAGSTTSRSGTRGR